MRKGAGAAVKAGATAVEGTARMDRRSNVVAQGNIALAPTNAGGMLSYGARQRAARRLRRFSVGPG